jgi:hydrogenase expression/formation protein HypC
VSLALVDDAQVGDYVIVHVGFAIGRVDADEAERTLALFAEMAAQDAAAAATAP